jgi:hypothetical protein
VFQNSIVAEHSETIGHLRGFAPPERWAQCRPPPLCTLILLVSSWLGRHQTEAIEYLRAENRALRAHRGPKRLRFTDAERRLLAEKGRPLGRKRLAEIASLATPETNLRWYRERVAAKYDGTSPRAGPGRPRSGGAGVATSLTSASARRRERAVRDLGQKVATPEEEGHAREEGGARQEATREEGHAQGELQEALGLTIHASDGWYARCLEERSSARSSRPQGATKMATKKTGGRKYGKRASAKVAKTMHELKEGTLRSGSSGKRVTSRKQAIAIGLSEARRAGKKVPKKNKKKGSSKKG